jgi:hypothetical protein
MNSNANAQNLIVIASAAWRSHQDSHEIASAQRPRNDIKEKMAQ